MFEIYNLLALKRSSFKLTIVIANFPNINDIYIVITSSKIYFKEITELLINFTKSDMST